MRIAITGAFGFIGTHLVDHLLKGDFKNCNFILVDYWWEKIGKLEKSKNFEHVRKIYQIISSPMITVLNPDEFLNAEKCDLIIHLGANCDTLDLGSRDLYQKNLQFISEMLGSHDEAKYVFASSASVYGNGSGPLNPYALTKVLGERKFFQNSTILRFFNVFGNLEASKGPMASIPWKIANAIKNKEKIQIHSLDAHRDFISVNIVSEVITKIAQMVDRSFRRDQKDFTVGYDLLFPDEEEQKIFDVGSGRATSFQELLDFFAKLHSVDIKSFCDIVKTPENPRYQNFTKAGVALKNAPEILGLNRSVFSEMESLYGP